MTLSPFIIIAVIIFRLIMAGGKSETGTRVKAKWRSLRFRNADALLGNNFIDSHKLFAKLNRQLPSVTVIRDIDVSEAVKFLDTFLDTNIKAVYRHNHFDFDEGCGLFNMMIIVTQDNTVIEIGKGYEELQYTLKTSAWVNSLAKDLAKFRVETEPKALTKDICVTGFAGHMN